MVNMWISPSWANVGTAPAVVLLRRVALWGASCRLFVSNCNSINPAPQATVCVDKLALLVRRSRPASIPRPANRTKASDYILPEQTAAEFSSRNTPKQRGHAGDINKKTLFVRTIRRNYIRGQKRVLSDKKKSLFSRLGLELSLNWPPPH